MRTTSLTVALLLSATYCNAQAPDTQVTSPTGVSAPAPDFGIKMNIDYPQPMNLISRQVVVAGGWGFECRSGLQPVTQRVGNVLVRFVASVTSTTGVAGQEFLPQSVTTVNGSRPDAGAAFAQLCPASGTSVGMSIIITGLPPAGLYQMTIMLVTFDNAGRIAMAWQSIPVRIVDGPV